MEDQLLTMDTAPPDHTDPFLPAYDINNSPALGIVYRTNLQEYPFSESLRNLIQEWLYERPAHRPDIIKLKEKVQEGLTAAIEADPTAEPWLDFLPAEPIPPLVANPPALPEAGPGSTPAEKRARRQAQEEARR
jgi:hypothetical protein